MARGLLAAVGIGVALVSAFFVAAAVVESASGGDGRTSPGVYAGLIVFFGGTLPAGLYLAWRMLWPRPGTASAAEPPVFAPTGSAPTAADRERRVLRLAEKERGRLTVPETAARCNLTIGEAKEALDRLVVQQVAELHVTESGVLVYVFPGFLSDTDKARARDF